jgi:SSS family solute:Na+ symporter
LPAHSVDLAILAAYLAGTVLFGLVVGRRQQGVDDYMVGNRDIPWWALLFSIVATETSTVTFLSIPGFAFARDMTWLQIAFGFVAGRFAVQWLLLPGYFAGSFFTAYEVLGRRFGGAVKPMASLLFMVTRSLADGLRLFLTAIVVQEMAHISLPWAIVLVGATTILYTVVGGMKAVVWTDVAQFVVYIAGAALALALLLGRIPGGWPRLMALASAHGKLRVLDLGASLTNPYVLWAGLFGGAFLTLGSHGSDQLMVQRYFCARSEREAGRALWVSGFVVLAQFAFFLFIGVALWGYYTLVPPAVPFDRPDRVFVHFIVTEMPAGVLGIVVGAIFAAAMSTLSSSLNASATAAVTDFYRPLRPQASPDRLLRVTRAFTAFFGAVQMGVAFLGPRLAESIVSEVLTIAGFTTGIILGVFFLGLFTRVGARSALTAMILGLALMTWVHLGTPLAWPWYAMVGSLGTFAMGALVEGFRPSRAQ